MQTGRKLCCFLLLIFACAVSAQGNVATQWAQFLDETLINTSSANIGPNAALAVGQARAIYLLDSAMYDAWTAFDTNAISSTFRNDPSATPRLQGTAADMDEAISFAAFRMMLYLFSDSNATMALITSFFTDTIGFDATLQSTDLSTPVGIGITAASRLIAQARVDGTNAQGNAPTAQTDAPYADYTNYFPVNDPVNSTDIMECHLRSIAHWTPLIVNGQTQVFNVPYTPLVQPFSLTSFNEFPIPGPPLPNTPENSEYIANHQQLLNISATLDDIEKVTAEFWATASGAQLWFRITYQTAINANLTTSESVQLLFAQGAALWDSAIASWAFKRIYDTGRAVTVIPCLFNQQEEQMWGGPYQGTVTRLGSQWVPYLETPAFASYPSGHSTFAAAGAEILQQFLGSDTFLADNVCVDAGDSQVEPRITAPSNPNFVAGVTNVPNTGPGTPGFSPANRTCLNYETYTEAAQQCGLSRLFAGFHIMADHLAGLDLGQNVASQAISVTSALINPTGSTA